MGGGEVFPSAATVQSLLETAKKAETEGNFHLSGESYREASEILLTMAKSNAVTDDERYCFEMQSSEFLNKAIQIERAHPAPNSFNVKEEISDNSPFIPVAEGVEGLPEQRRTSEQTGAAVVGATSGFCVGSVFGIPIIGTVAGGLFGGVAATRNDQYGEKARSIGRYGADAIDGSYELNTKYNITGNIKVGVESVMYKAKEFDERHDVVGKVVNTTSTAWKKIVELEEKHQLTSKAADAVKSAANGVVAINDKYKITDRIGDAVSQALKPRDQGQENRS